MKKRIIAVALALVMLLSFAACSGKKDDKKDNDSSSEKTTTTEALKSGEELFYGSWVAPVSLANILQESSDDAEEYSEYFEDIDMKLTFTFKEDNSYSLTWEDDDIKDAVADIKDAMTAAICDMIRDSVPELKGKSDKEAIEYYEKMSGTSFDDAIEEQFGEKALKESAKDIAQDGKFKVVKDRLYFYSGDNFEAEKADHFVFTAESNDKVKVTDVNFAGSKDSENIFGKDLTLERID